LGGTIWFIPFVDKHVGGRLNCVIPLTRAVPEHVRGGLRRCVIQINVYFTLLTLLQWYTCSPLKYSMATIEK